MKNIHLLPTDKSSNLAYKIGNISGEECLFRRVDYSFINGGGTRNQNIYIISDEEIKERDWFITTDTNEIHKSDWIKFIFNNGKKIILTTDVDLIKDGVQAIPDEFLEWFVKNPSCEMVEVKNFYGFSEDYLIIIPKEELKKKYSNSYNEEDDKLRSEILNKYLDSKQETLEEAAERLYPIILEDDEWDKNKQYRDEWIEGAKWQQEKLCDSEVIQRIRASKSDAEARRIIRTI